MIYKTLLLNNNDAYITNEMINRGHVQALNIVEIRNPCPLDSELTHQINLTYIDDVVLNQDN